MAAPVVGLWTDDLLDALSRVGDSSVDAVVAEHAAWHPDRSAGEIVGQIGAHGSLPPERRSPVIERYLAQDPALPTWASPNTMARGVAFFDLYGLEIGLALFCASLPESYASARGAKVLASTARLVSDPVRRIYETAQFLVDVMAPDGLQPGAPGMEAIKRVRLMHAGVRYLFEHDPHIEVVDDVAPEGERWSSHWGVPLNQEDELGGLMTFTTAAFDALDRMGVSYDAADAEAYLHLWCVIGFLLGVAPAHLPMDLASARELTVALRRRNYRGSSDGRYLGDALIGALRSTYRFRVFAGIPSALIWWYTSPQVADIVGARAGVYNVLFRPLGRLLRAISLKERHDALLRALTRAASARILRDFVEHGHRRGVRPAFSLPRNLHEQVKRPLKRFG